MRDPAFDQQLFYITGFLGGLSTFSSYLFRFYLFLFGYFKGMTILEQYCWGFFYLLISNLVCGTLVFFIQRQFNKKQKKQNAKEKGNIPDWLNDPDEDDDENIPTVNPNTKMHTSFSFHLWSLNNSSFLDKLPNKEDVHLKPDQPKDSQIINSKGSFFGGSKASFKVIPKVDLDQEGIEISHLDNYETNDAKYASTNNNQETQ